MDARTFLIDDRNQGHDECPHAPPALRTSFLDLAIESTVGKATVALGISAHPSQDAHEFAKTAIKTLPMFVPGLSGFGGTALVHGLDQASPNDSSDTQVADALLGASKGVLLKLCLSAMGGNGSHIPGSIKGLSLGVFNRAAETGMDWRTYRTASGDTDIFGGLGRVGKETFNPAAIGTDMFIFGMADGFEGFFDYKMKGRIRAGGMMPVLFPSLVFGATDGSLRELKNQMAQGAGVDFTRVAYKGVLNASASAFGALPSAYLHARSNTLPLPEVNKLAAARKYTPEQIAMMNEPLVLHKAVDGLHSKTFTGHQVDALGNKPAFFRVDDNTPVFRNRQNNEVTGYSLNRLIGFTNVDPIAAPKSIVLDGRSLNGYVQSAAGRSLEDGLRTMAARSYDSGSNANVLRLLKENPALRDRVTEALAQRMVFGEMDNHFHNLVLSGVQSKPNVGNIDLEIAFPAAVYKSDLVPRWHKTMSFSGSLGDQVSQQLAGSRLAPETQAALSKFSALCKTNPEAVMATGLTFEQFRGVAGRSEWFATHGTLPVKEVPSFVKWAATNGVGYYKDLKRPVASLMDHKE